MTVREFKAFLREQEWSDYEAARELKVSRGSIQNWKVKPTRLTILVIEDWWAKNRKGSKRHG